MKKTRNLLIIAIATTVAFLGCMKERTTPIETPKTKSSTESVTSLQDGIAREMTKGDTYHWRKTDAEILAEKNAWLNSISVTNYLNKGTCGSHISHYGTIIEAQRICGSGWELTYRYWSFDNQNSDWFRSTLSTTYAEGMYSVTPQILDSGIEFVHQNPNPPYNWLPVDCDAWSYDGFCTSISSIDYSFISSTNGNLLPGELIGTLSLQFYLGNTNICLQQNINHSVTSWTANDYQDNLAHAWVHGSASKIVILNDWSIPCIPYPIFLYPNGGATFEYRLIGSTSPYTVVQIPPSGPWEINNVPSGVYEYRVTCHYIINGTTVSSQPKPGTVTVL